MKQNVNDYRILNGPSVDLTYVFLECPSNVIIALCTIHLTKNQLPNGQDVITQLHASFKCNLDPRSLWLSCVLHSISRSNGIYFAIHYRNVIEITKQNFVNALNFNLNVFYFFPFFSSAAVMCFKKFRQWKGDCKRPLRKRVYASASECCAGKGAGWAWKEVCNSTQWLHVLFEFVPLMV